MEKLFFISLFFLFQLKGMSQDEEPDSLQILGEVTVKAFEQYRKQNQSTVVVKVIETNNADRNGKTSLVSGFNTIAGVRMEERSPGSYRINIRGSSLRSPFGVRNVKIYWNGIPVTDAGGNTYFNQFAFTNFSHIEIFKGPASSLYGSGTGGLILIQNFERWKAGASMEYTAGSFGTHNLLVNTGFGKNENINQLGYAHLQTDGYRIQTKMHRDNFSWISKIKINERNQLTASFLYNDMYYQTPGALTASEFIADPKSARPAAGGFPSAVEAKAAIYQKNILAGFTNEFSIDSNWKNTSTLYGSYAQVKNPAVRNYERRIEPQFGARSFFTWTDNLEQFEWKLQAGAEFIQGYFNNRVSKNIAGNPDSVRTNDDVENRSYHIFAQVDMDFNKNWFVTAGMSLNHSRIAITRLNAYPVLTQSRDYKLELAPRIALLKRFGESLSWRLSGAKGFSPPTTAEVLPSTGLINTELEAEHGWNLETMLGYSLLHNRLRFELTGFYFKLDNALVQRRDLSGADFFVNAGNSKQKGIEFHADYYFLFPAGKSSNQLVLRSDYTFSHFRYGNFIRGIDWQSHFKWRE